MEQLNIVKKGIENLIAQLLQILYFDYLQQHLEEISFQWLDNKLIIVVEGTVTQPERILYQHNYQSLAYQIREVIDQIVLTQVKQLLEQGMQVKVTDFLTDTSIETGRTGVIAIFEWRSPVSS